MAVIAPPYEVLNLFPSKLFIDGEWVDADNGKTFKVYNPANGDVLKEVPEGGTDETRRAIEAAQRAFPVWSGMSGRQRSQYLYKAYQLMRKHRKELATLLTLEQGKALEAAEAEVVSAGAFLSWYVEEAKRINSEVISSYDPTKRVYTLRQPVGVVVAVTPWNFPADMVTRKVGPALAAGCTVVLKPSSQTPLIAMALVSLFEAAGLPKGVLNLVVGRTGEIGNEIMSNEYVRKITLTGSTDVGKWFMAQASKQLKRVSLELGGNAPYIVCQDADIDKAVRGIIASRYRNSGQVCASPNRVYVHKLVAEEFAAKLVAAAANVKVGPGWHPGVQMGPMIDENAVKKMQEYVDDAQGKGAEVLFGGQRIVESELHLGSFYAPTVIYHARDNMLLANEEVFGPIAPIFTYEDDDEVLERVNRSKYGLGGYVYTNNLNRAIVMSERMECGIVGVNDPLPAAIEAPFGGVKESGIGREGGHWGMDEFLETKTVSIQL